MGQRRKQETYMLSRRDLANAIRALSMDAVQKANSGHPGAPMGMADIAEVLWNDYLRHNPANPRWIDRDRFIMSNGHGCMLWYALLHLTGYDLPLEEIKQFRQLHSKTPGHPEYGATPGVETTTGPLGQGLSNAVGIAIAERVLADQFNRDGHNIVDHYTYVTMGDGCLMEGISHEACSLAGTLGLGKLIAIYDNNQVSIDGPVAGWFTDNTNKRFEAYGWHVIPNIDGHDPDKIAQAIKKARTVLDKPSIINCNTVIGWGSPNKQGKAASHGAPLGEDEVALAREAIGWRHEPFVIPDEHYAGWDARARGARLEAEWNDRFAAYRKEYPHLAAEFERRTHGDLPIDWEKKAKNYIRETQSKSDAMASRKASQNALDAYGPLLPELIGGSADLTGSNLTKWSGSKPITKASVDGNYIHYGVREFAMAGIMNGIASHGGFIPYGGTFLVFTDYARNALRLAALMRIRSILVLTHDSIGLGEDGPTHQAVEHAASLRLMPNMSVWRPCDAVEAAVAWKAAIERTDGPTALLFTRQKIAHHSRTPKQVSNIARGGYVLIDCEGKPDAIIIATGSEVELAVNAAEQLKIDGIKIRVVSMPSTDVFDNQDDAYKESVLPCECGKRVAVEAGVTDYWRKYVGLNGRVIGIDTFGESAPAQVVFKHFGFTVDNVISVVKDLLAA